LNERNITLKKNRKQFVPAPYQNFFERPLVNNLTLQMYEKKTFPGKLFPFLNHSQKTTIHYETDNSFNVCSHI
jgi:hypothetical protein